MSGRRPPRAIAAKPAAPPAAPDSVLPADLAARVKAAPRCGHCGGVHVRACPRVKRMAWHPNGQLSDVEFWPDNRWSDEHIIWPEQVTDDAA